MQEEVKKDKHYQVVVNVLQEEVCKGTLGSKTLMQHLKGLRQVMKVNKIQKTKPLFTFLFAAKFPASVAD